MGQTANYGLKQWESWEAPRRTDLNQVVDSIDTALAGLEAGKTALVAGTYTGDSAQTRFIPLGFTPKWFLSFDSAGHSAIQGSCYGGLALEGHGVTHGSGYGVEIVEGGIQVGYDFPTGRSTNTANQIYHYIACVG